MKIDISTNLIINASKYLLSYKDKRYLDAWARILHIQGQCSAIFQDNEILYITFSPAVAKSSEEVYDIIQCGIDVNIEAVLLTVLSFNRDIIHTLNRSTSSLANILETMPAKLVAAKKKNKLLNFFQDNAITISIEIKNTLKEMKDEKFTKGLKRLIQDIFKLNLIGYGGVKKIIYVENDEKLHAELALAEKLKTNKNAIQYIGVSKLCCYICDEILTNKWQIDHRGTHGTLYLNGFTLPPSLDIKYAEELLEKIDNHRKSGWLEADDRITNNEIIIYQHRHTEEPDLSDDEELERKIKINDDTSLWDFKNQVLMNSIKLINFHLFIYSVIQISNNNAAKY